MHDRLEIDMTVLTKKEKRIKFRENKTYQLNIRSLSCGGINLLSFKTHESNMPESENSHNIAFNNPQLDLNFSGGDLPIISWFHSVKFRKMNHPDDTLTCLGKIGDLYKFSNHKQYPKHMDGGRMLFVDNKTGTIVMVNTLVEKTPGTFLEPI
jgi:hypothetical protein